MAKKYIKRYKFWLTSHSTGQPLLKGKGTISNAEMEEKVREIYGLFDAKRKENEALQADQDDLAELKLLGAKIEKSK